MLVILKMQKVFCWDEANLITLFVRIQWEKIVVVMYKDLVCGVKREAKKGKTDKIKGLRLHVLES